MAGRRNGRESLLSATVEATTRLLRGDDVDQSIPEVLSTLGKATNVDRMQLLCMQHNGFGMRCTHVFSWCAPGVPEAYGLKSNIGKPTFDHAFDDWGPLFMRGEIVVRQVANLDANKRAVFDIDHVKSIIAVPIFVAGDWWGCIAFDSCRAERTWLSSEIDILKMLAEVVGAAIERTRTLTELAVANRIIERSTTILFRLIRTSGNGYALNFVSSNITRYGYTPKELLAAPERWMDIVDSADAPHVTDAITAVDTGRLTKVDAEFRLIRPDGSRVWFYGQASATHEPHSSLPAIEGIVTDITERKRAALEIERLASTDTVTGLANRSTFLRRLQNACRQSTETRSLVAVHYIDLDGFKQVNDSYGHIVGDELLNAVARRVERVVRKVDTVARIGGDEFAVLQPEPASEQDAIAVAHRIRATLRRPYKLGGKTVQIGASVGIDCRAGDDADGDIMLAHADCALYRAKADGRNCVRIFDQIDEAQGCNAQLALHSSHTA